MITQPCCTPYLLNRKVCTKYPSVRSNTVLTWALQYIFALKESYAIGIPNDTRGPKMTKLLKSTIDFTLRLLLRTPLKRTQ